MPFHHDRGVQGMSRELALQAPQDRSIVGLHGVELGPLGSGIVLDHAGAGTGLQIPPRVKYAGRAMINARIHRYNAVRRNSTRDNFPPIEWGLHFVHRQVLVV